MMIHSKKRTKVWINDTERKEAIQTIVGPHKQGLALYSLSSQTSKRTQPLEITHDIHHPKLPSNPVLLAARNESQRIGTPTPRSTTADGEADDKGGA